MAPRKHTTRPKLVISRSPGTAESRTRSAACPFLDPSLPFIQSPTESVSMQNVMARTKKTAMISNSDGSSQRVLLSETSDQAPDVERGDCQADSSERGTKVFPSHLTVDMSNLPSAPSKGEEAGPSRRGEESSSSDSSGDESESSSSDHSSSGSEEKHSRLQEARSSHAVEKGDNWAEPSASYREENAPYYCRVPRGRIATMRDNVASFIANHKMGPEYLLFVPDPEDTVVWPAGTSYGDGCFGCYVAAIKAGLRFPLHPAVQRILDGYDLGLWQLAPNSWVNVLGYVAGCEMYGVEPSFEAFAHMNYLSRTPKSGGTGWYQLTSHRGYLMTRGKANKWKDWRNTFLIIESSDTELNKRFNKWNRDPPLLAGGRSMPPVPPKAKREILDKGLFKVETRVNSTSGVREQVPLNCVPSFKWLYDEYFLAACGLSSRCSRGSRPDEYSVFSRLVYLGFLLTLLFISFSRRHE